MPEPSTPEQLQHLRAMRQSPHAGWFAGRLEDL